MSIENKHTVLVTGAAGMIGSYIVSGLLYKGYSVIGLDRKDSSIPVTEAYSHYVLDLSDAAAVTGVFKENKITHVIHLAALAHTAGEADLSWDKYYQVNVVNARNVFTPAAERKIPILFSSTADVYGLAKGVVNGQSEIHPVGFYGKSKAKAEKELIQLCTEKQSPFTIFRFAPVYTEQVKRDIQKRYYLKYPKIAYLVGGGTEYEVLDVHNAVKAIVSWCSENTVYNITPDIRNIKNEKLLNTADCVNQERAEGRAMTVLKLPHWLVAVGFNIAKAILGKNNPKVYLLNKVVNPLRTE